MLKTDQDNLVLALRLEKAIKNLEPVPDSDVKWMREHRPSVAVLLAIGSGPWRLPRRFTVQANAIKILGTRDLSELKPRDIYGMFPLDWEHKYLKACVATAKSFGGSFDTLFTFSRNTQSAKSRDRQKYMYSLVMEIHFRAHGYFYIGARSGSSFKKPLPKVMGMFVRDYLYQDSVPCDRHVKKWLREHKLPTNPDKVLKLFHTLGLDARGYARALFMSKSSNPEHPTEKTSRKESVRKLKAKP